MDKIPKVKSKVFTERFSVPIDPEMKRRISELKLYHGVHMTDWARSVLIPELAKLEKKLVKATGL